VSSDFNFAILQVLLGDCYFIPEFN